MFGDHSKARRAAIHCVYLLVIGERHGAIAVSIFKKQKLKDKEKYLKQACLTFIFQYIPAEQMKTLE